MSAGVMLPHFPRQRSTERIPGRLRSCDDARPVMSSAAIPGTFPCPVDKGKDSDPSGLDPLSNEVVPSDRTAVATNSSLLPPRDRQVVPRVLAVQSYNCLRIGLHTSKSGSLEGAALKAHEVGANCFQIFSSSPVHGGPAGLIQPM